LPRRAETARIWTVGLNKKGGASVTVYNCFWVQGDCIGDKETYSCKGCRQYPYGEGDVEPPRVPSDIGHQIMGMHVGVAELLAKKGIARPEEVDEAIARNIERLAGQDRMMREAVQGVEHVQDSMIRLTEPGKLEVFVALDEEGEADRDSVCDKVAESLQGLIPKEVEVCVHVAEPRREE